MKSQRGWWFAGTLAAAAFAPLPAAAQPQPFTVADKIAMLDAHNLVRCGVSPTAQVMPPLVWDAALEATAQAWAAGCVDLVAPLGLLDHNPDRSDDHPFYVGENIYGTGGAVATPAAAVALWAAEAANYNFANNTCSGICGHYTQIVWANTRKVGCARYNCSALQYHSTIVCDYGPGGNIGGQRPYVAGAAVNGACDLVFQDGFEL
jgi:hypothetical protein